MGCRGSLAGICRDVVIPFIQITAEGVSTGTTREQRLAREMGKPPWPVQPISASVPVKAWALSQTSADVGMIFDPEFWYSDSCWIQWVDNCRLHRGHDDIAVPLGNQNPSWRTGLNVPLYATLRQLEAASAFEAPALWRQALAGHTGDFAVCVSPVSLLRRLPENLLFGNLPEYWANARQKIQIFCKGWLHAFNAVQDSGRREDLAAMCGWKGSVLELGCDRGLMAANIRNTGLNVSWVGLDMNRTALETARIHMQMAIQADLTRRLPFLAETKFDRIVCGDVLEHLAYPGDLLARLRELIAPEGTMLASFPNIGHWSVIEDLLA
ncbi:MAG: methyltransferase domain-containing protein, partial [Desulfatirhabdiaceae bacterium]|nr:methyltransferase domain-containing protein [Desulfatirhabdiaceae bacterium]